MAFLDPLSYVDSDIYHLIERERLRQNEGLELIASENFVSRAVLEAVGSVLTNKYAEGYPSKRYYGGCEVVDEVETIAIQRAQALFQCEYVNVQAHSGSQANMAVYFAALEPQDTLLAMSLDQGGHLTHGASVNFSGKLYRVISYGVRQEDQRIDYEQVRTLAEQHRPKLIVAGASSYPRQIDFAEFKRIADEYGARLMVDMAHIAGLVAAGIHPSPVPYADFVTTTTHKTLRGPRGGIVMSKEPYAKALASRIFPGIQGGPLMHVIAAKAVALGEALKPEFKVYQQQIVDNCQALAKALMAHGYSLVSNGTDNHMLLIDLRGKQFTHSPSLSGKQAEVALGACGITVNKNKIPFDPTPATVTSGIRIGTPAVTTRGMQQQEMVMIAELIDQALESHGNDTAQAQVKKRVQKLCASFPLYG